MQICNFAFGHRLRLLLVQQSLLSAQLEFREDAGAQPCPSHNSAPLLRSSSSSSSRVSLSLSSGPYRSAARIVCCLTKLRTGCFSRYPPKSHNPSSPPPRSGSRPAPHGRLASFQPFPFCLLPPLAANLARTMATNGYTSPSPPTPAALDIQTAAVTGDDTRLSELIDRAHQDAVRRYRVREHPPSFVETPSDQLSTQAIEIEALVGRLKCSLNQQSSLRDAMPHVHFTGATVPPIITAAQNPPTSSSSDAQPSEGAPAEPLSPEFLTYRPDLLSIRKEAFLEYILEVFNITLYETPFIDLPHDVWKVIEKFLQLLMPEPCAPFAPSSHASLTQSHHRQADRIPRKQNEEIAKWHLSRVRAVFAAFIDVYNVLLDKRSPDERLAFGADSTRIGVFIPDGTFYLKHPHGDAYAVMQSECKRLDQAAQKSISVESAAQHSATSPSAPSSTTTTSAPQADSDVDMSIVPSSATGQQQSAPSLASSAANPPSTSTSPSSTAPPPPALESSTAGARIRAASNGMTGTPSTPSTHSPTTPITRRKAQHPILGVVCDIKAIMSAQQKPYVKLFDLDIQRKETTVYGKQVLVLKAGPHSRLQAKSR